MCPWLLSGNPLNTDTPIIRTFWRVPLVSVLTGFHCMTEMVDIATALPQRSISPSSLVPRAISAFKMEVPPTILKAEVALGTRLSPPHYEFGSLWILDCPHSHSAWSIAERVKQTRQDWTPAQNEKRDGTVWGREAHTDHLLTRTSLSSLSQKPRCKTQSHELDNGYSCSSTLHKCLPHP